MMITFFYLEGGSDHMVMTDNPNERELARIKYGGVYDTRTEAREALALLQTMAKPKERNLSEEERKQLELEQIAFGRSQTPESERPPKRKTAYDRLLEEFNFAAEYEGWSKAEYERKRKAFNQRNWYLKKLCKGVYV